MNIKIAKQNNYRAVREKVLAFPADPKPNKGLDQHRNRNGKKGIDEVVKKVKLVKLFVNGFIAFYCYNISVAGGYAVKNLRYQ